MEGTLRKRQSLPSVLQSFAPTRLADEVLSGVYERLLAMPDRLVAVNSSVKVEEMLANGSFGQLATTGGRYE
jgi:hypothetical protein